MCLENPCLIIYLDRKLSELLDRVDELLTASVKLQKIYEKWQTTFDY